MSKVASEKMMKLQKSWSSLNMHHFKSQGGVTTRELMEMYKADPAVEYVEPNYVFDKLDFENEAVTGLSESDVQTMAAGDYSQSSAPIQAEDAWATLSNSGQKPIVAVIDTGVDYTHSVFSQSGAIWTNTGEIPNNGLDDDANGFIDDVRGWNFVSNNNNPMDDNNHGTHVAGIVLGVGQDIIDTVPREAARIQIMPLKFLDGNGSGSTASAVAAIYYAVNNGAKVINNSWGGASYSAALHEALAYAYNARVFVTAAAGNAGSNNDSKPIFPANYDVPSLLSVASTTDSDAMSFFSNFGFGTVHLGSPGSGIKSTLPGNTFGFLSGTSMAAPAVAGIAALMMYERPSMIGFQVKNIIYDQSQAVSGLSGKVNSQSRVNVLNSVSVAKSVSLNSSQPSYTVSADQFSREIASAAENGAACGLVKSVTQTTGVPWGVLVLLSLPVALFAAMRIRKAKDLRRQHERFSINTDVKMSVGGRELVGKVNSISQGGVRVNAEELIEKGSIVTLCITGPDGNETVQVEGNIVWSEESQECGIQFAENKMAQATVAGWTKGLKKE